MSANPAQTTAKSRRCLQFGLRTLFILTAVAAVCFAWVASLRRDFYTEQRIVYALGGGEQHQGVALLNEGTVLECGTGIDVFAYRRCTWPSWMQTPARALDFDYGERVVKIVISQFAECDEKEFRDLKNFAYLELLVLDGYPATDECIAVIQHALPECKIVRHPPN